MSIAHPPKENHQNGRHTTVDRFINGAKATNVLGDKDVTVSVRIPPGELAKIDELVQSSRVKSSRQAWIMGAIYDKLDGPK